MAWKVPSLGSCLIGEKDKGRYLLRRMRREKNTTLDTETDFAAGGLGNNKQELGSLP